MILSPSYVCSLRTGRELFFLGQENQPILAFAFWSLLGISLTPTLVEIMNSQDRLEYIQQSATKEVHASPSLLTESDIFHEKFRNRDVENTVTNVDELQLSTLEKNELIIDWDGPDDPEMALNWPVKKKWVTVILLSTLTLLTYVESDFYYDCST
jgi:hypothetical protein